jgi:hypothetical protein
VSEAAGISVDVRALVQDHQLVSALSPADTRKMLRVTGHALARITTFRDLLFARMFELTAVGESQSAASTPAREFIGPVEAARLAGLLEDESEETRKRALKRIYEWAKGRAWAKRPNRKTLLIDRDAFARWVDAR